MGRDVPKNQDKLLHKKPQHQVQPGVPEANPVGQKKSGMSVHSGNKEIGAVSKQFNTQGILENTLLTFAFDN